MEVPMRILHLDPFSGISGDMTVGALVDAGADSQALVAALDSLATGARFTIDRTKRCGITAAKFLVAHDEQKKHRHLPAIVRMIEAAALSDRAKQTAIRIFTRLGEAEASVHGVPMERVHFHEVGAIDSIADIVGAAVGLDLLNVDAVHCSPINVGSGTVNTEHGLLPVPAPATSLLLRDIPVYARGPAMELTTPTGAAIACTLAQSFGAMPPLTIRALGYGAGDRDFKEHANVLRVILGETSGATETTSVAVLEANIDDSTPEVLGYAMERLFEGGALDVTLESVLMKKNRPGTLLRVIARPEDRERLADTMLAETSTLGVRFHTAERRVQSRRMVQVNTAHGSVRVKVAANGGFAPEYEDCRQLAIAKNIPLSAVLAAASQSYLNSNR
jgi:pyridinium-3,5-bisthiocarboxylic acid mononucleotide nickel chelatase